MGILLDKVRIYGFRGLKNLEVNLEPITVLTGMNNTGKTSFLKALQIVFGNRQFITSDDFFMSDDGSINQIIIDIRIISINDSNDRETNFSEDWEVAFNSDRIIYDDEGKSCVSIRTIVTIDDIKNTYKTKQYTLDSWNEFEGVDGKWFMINNHSSKDKPFHIEEIPFFYMDAKRDIIDDIKVRNSYLGKMLAKIKYSDEDIRVIELKIKELNDKAVNNSNILSDIANTLKDLDTAMDSSGNGVEITPFPKKIRDLNKGVSIQYSDFSMDYQGMGTRSWSSLLTLKSFIHLFDKKATNNEDVLFPIVAIEEPEAHLHPNAQKRLYTQISSIKGQKIISTHSPYISASAELKQIRNLFKGNDDVKCGQIDMSALEPEDIRKIKRQVINTRGEIFFSKAVVLFEGETEEQALPIFAEKYFAMPSVELGIDFIGVGGLGNYLPFIRVADNLNIPWFIFSDGEDAAITKIIKDLKKIKKVEEINISDEGNVFILNSGSNFERNLINDGYITEIEDAFSKLHSATYIHDKISSLHNTQKKPVKTDEICETCNQNIFEGPLRNYIGDDGYKEALYDLMTSEKTKFGPIIANSIINSDKPLPRKVTELFDKIKETFEN